MNIYWIIFFKLWCVNFIKWSKSWNEFMIESFGRGRIAQGAILSAENLFIARWWILILVPPNVLVSISTASLRHGTLQIEHGLSQCCIIHFSFRWKKLTLVFFDNIVVWEPGLWACKEPPASAFFITNRTNSEKWVNLIGMIKAPLCRASASTIFPCSFVLSQFDVLGKISARVKSKGIYLRLFLLNDQPFGNLSVIANQVLDQIVWAHWR